MSPDKALTPTCPWLSLGLARKAEARGSREEQSLGSLPTHQGDRDRELHPAPALMGPATLSLDPRGPLRNPKTRCAQLDPPQSQSSPPPKTATLPGSIPPVLVILDWKTKQEACLRSRSIVSHSAPSICYQRNLFQSPCDLPLTVPVLRSLSTERTPISRELDAQCVGRPVPPGNWCRGRA